MREIRGFELKAKVSGDVINSSQLTAAFQAVRTRRIKVKDNEPASGDERPKDEADGKFKDDDGPIENSVDEAMLCVVHGLAVQVSWTPRSATELLQQRQAIYMEEFVKPTSYDLLVFDGLNSMARFLDGHNLLGLHPDEVPDKIPPEFGQVKHLDVTAYVYDQGPHLRPFLHFLDNCQRRRSRGGYHKGHTAGTFPPLFGKLETLHVKLVYHHPDNTMNLPIGEWFNHMVQGLFSAASARNVRLIHMMVQEPRLEPQPGEQRFHFCKGTMCNCHLASFPHRYRENWFPIQSQLEDILQSYPLIAYEMPFVPRELPRYGMRMIMDFGFEGTPDGRRFPHPVPALMNGNTAIDGHDMQMYMKDLLDYIEENDASEEQSDGSADELRGEGEANEETFGPLWFISGSEAIHRKFLGARFLPAIQKIAPLSLDPITKVVLGRALHKQLFDAHWSRVAESKPFKLDSGAAWREWVGAA